MINEAFNARVRVDECFLRISELPVGGSSANNLIGTSTTSALGGMGGHADKGVADVSDAMGIEVEMRLDSHVHVETSCLQMVSYKIT